MNWRDVAGLQAEQDQDMANALKWWEETSNADKMRIWDYIQKPVQTDMQELLSRFAQLGMTHIALEAAKGGPREAE